MAVRPASSLVDTVPLVSSVELADFFTKHFSGYSKDHFATTFLAEGLAEEEDDNLGYYEDGVKRTLTDEQIAMFRRTEIETLVREKRRSDEAKADKADRALELEQDIAKDPRSQDTPLTGTQASNVSLVPSEAGPSLQTKPRTEDKKKKSHFKRNIKPDLRKRTWDRVDHGLETEEQFPTTTCETATMIVRHHESDAISGAGMTARITPRIASLPSILRSGTALDSQPPTTAAQTGIPADYCPSEAMEWGPEERWLAEDIIIHFATKTSMTNVRRSSRVLNLICDIVDTSPASPGVIPESASGTEPQSPLPNRRKLETRAEVTCQITDGQRTCMFYRHRDRFPFRTPYMQTAQDMNPSRRPVLKKCYSGCMIDGQLCPFAHSIACSGV
ncbi:hypothetical protein V490_01103 [Pseudogymnoascus sp. VKM F-3557]|nr:hypothetical protein V490_01103 [Pseudogymnoascus sp. VKM F-3557]